MCVWVGEKGGTGTQRCHMNTEQDVLLLLQQLASTTTTTTTTTTMTTTTTARVISEQCTEHSIA